MSNQRKFDLSIKTRRRLEQIAEPLCLPKRADNRMPRLVAFLGNPAIANRRRAVRNDMDVSFEARHARKTLARKCAGSDHDIGEHEFLILVCKFLVTIAERAESRCPFRMQRALLTLILPNLSPVDNRMFVNAFHSTALGNAE